MPTRSSLSVESVRSVGRTAKQRRRGSEWNCGLRFCSVLPIRTIVVVARVVTLRFAAREHRRIILPPTPERSDATTQPAGRNAATPQCKSSAVARSQQIDWGTGLCRTSSIESKGSVPLPKFREPLSLARPDITWHANMHGISRCKKAGCSLMHGI